MLLNLTDMQQGGRSICINSGSITCFYPEGKEGTVICFTVLDDVEDKQRGFAIKVKEAFQDIFETLQACGEALSVIRGHGLPEDRREPC